VQTNGASAAKCQSSPQQKSEPGDQRSCDANLMMCLGGVNSSGGSGNNPFSHVAQPLFSIKEMLP